MSDFFGELAQVVGKNAIVQGELLTSRAASYWDSSPTTALAIVKPRNTAQLSEVMKLCYVHNQAVVVQGGLTGCAAGAVACGEELIVSLENMAAIEEIDVVAGTATVQAGVVLEQLQLAARERDFIFPLDLGARGSCTIGGNIATNAGGINVLRYGMVRALVLGLEVVTPKGEILSSMNQMLKNNAGFDLKQLFIGSEGVLGIVTRAVVKLFPAPKTCETALVACADFGAVISLLNRIQKDLAGTLSAYEVMWGQYYDAVTVEGGHRAPLPRAYPFYVLVEAEGFDPLHDSDVFQGCLAQAMNVGTVVDAVICKSDSERSQVWEVRENFERILPSYLYDVSLPITKMESYVDGLVASLKERWANSICYVFGHVADGNLHLFIQTGASEDGHVDCNQIVYEPLEQLGGSVSAEHGIGTEKVEWLTYSRSCQEVSVMRQLKDLFDPDNLLNPERVELADGTILDPANWNSL